jgi:hypothetical protein
MRPPHFTLSKVTATGRATLRLCFEDGEQFDVDILPIIERHPTLAQLRNPSVFRKARRGEHGASVIWGDDDDLELAADNLRARAVEQAGGVSHEFIWNWMAGHGLTLDTGAEALGVSRRMLAYYRSGSKPVPRVVALACRGWEKNGDRRHEQALKPESIAIRRTFESGPPATSDAIVLPEVDIDFSSSKQRFTLVKPRPQYVIEAGLQFLSGRGIRRW